MAVHRRHDRRTRYIFDQITRWEHVVRVTRLCRQAAQQYRHDWRRVRPLANTDPQVAIASRSSAVPQGRQGSPTSIPPTGNRRSDAIILTADRSSRLPMPHSSLEDVLAYNSSLTGPAAGRSRLCPPELAQLSVCSTAHRNWPADEPSTWPRPADWWGFQVDALGQPTANRVFEEDSQLASGRYLCWWGDKLLEAHLRRERQPKDHEGLAHNEEPSMKQTESPNSTIEQSNLTGFSDTHATRRYSRSISFTGPRAMTSWGQ